MSKAIELLSANKSVKERAEKYEISIKRDVQKNIIHNLQTKIENLEDKIFELEDFSLETNVNHGRAALTKEECQQRFEHVQAVEMCNVLNLVD